MLILYLLPFFTSFNAYLLLYLMFRQYIFITVFITI